MTCAHCSFNIEEGAKIAQMPCCNLEYHSQCLINKIGSAIYHYYQCNCVCGYTLFEHNNESDNSDTVAQSVETILAKEGVKEELKALKQKIANERKAYRELDKHVKEEAAKFHETIQEHATVIKNEKEAVFNAIKDGEQYRAYFSAKRAIDLSHGKFMKKHNTNWRTMRDLLPCRRSWRYSSARYLMRRKFRLFKL